MTDESQAPEPALEGRKDAVKGWLQIGLIVLLIMTAVVVNRRLSAPSQIPHDLGQPQATLLVDVMTPHPTRETVRIEATGTIEARNTVSIVPEVGGRVQSVAGNFVAGGDFKADQLLFLIDPTDYQLALSKAKADLETAESALQLELAEAEIARDEWDVINPGEPIPALVGREPQIAQARATVSSARAQVETQQIQVNRTRFSLPFSGRVLSASVEKGATVSAGQSYGTVYERDALEAVVAVAEQEVAWIEPAIGRVAEVSGRINGRLETVSGHVARVEAELDNRTRQVGLVIKFAEPAPFLPGTFVDVLITGDAFDDVYVLPAQSVGPLGQAWIVDKGALQVRQTEVISRGEDLVIVRAFDFADGVVTTALGGVRAGQPVSVSGSASSTASALFDAGR